VTLLGQGVGLGDPQGSLPTPTVLWVFGIRGAAVPGLPGRVTPRRAPTLLTATPSRSRYRAGDGQLRTHHAQGLHLLSPRCPLQIFIQHTALAVSNHWRHFGVRDVRITRTWAESNR